MRSPIIENQVWGRIEIAEIGGFKDVKLYPGGARAWDWRETGTHHSPGIQRADAEELVQAGAEVIVLSRGHHEHLQVPADTVQWLESLGIEVHVLPTPQAAELYNRLAPRRKVGALLHSTC